jgi:hypothetical protein
MIEHAENRRRQDYAARVLAELRRRLAEHPLELRIVDHLAQELDEDDEEPPKPAELARALGVPVGEVYRACARIKRYRASVVAAVGGTGEEKQ